MTGDEIPDLATAVGEAVHEFVSLRNDVIDAYYRWRYDTANVELVDNLGSALGALHAALVGESS